jgi:hypothetical protein
MSIRLGDTIEFLVLLNVLPPVRATDRQGIVQEAKQEVERTNHVVLGWPILRNERVEADKLVCRYEATVLGFAPPRIVT